MADFSHDVKLSEKEINLIVRALHYMRLAPIAPPAYRNVKDLIEKLNSELKED